MGMTIGEDPDSRNESASYSLNDRMPSEPSVSLFMAGLALAIKRLTDDSGNVGEQPQPE